MTFLSRPTLIALVFGGVVFAYPILAAFMSIAGAGDSSTPSVILRFAVAIIALWYVARSVESLKSPSVLFALAFLLFWVLYYLRILIDGYVLQQPLVISVQYLLAYATLFSLIPALAGFSGLNLQSSQRTFNLLLFMGLAAFATVAMDSQELLSAYTGEGAGRFSLEKLNPISVGNVGSAILLLGMAGLFSDLNRGSGVLIRAVCIALIPLGVIALVFGASRGPILATLVALALFFVVPVSIPRLIVLAVVATGIGYTAVQTYMVGVERFSFDVVERILIASESGDSRLDLWRNAWQQFQENPLIGDSIAERSTGFYPHNSVLEALMATGLFGGIAYVFLLGWSIVASVRLLHRRLGYEWLALLCIQSAIGSFFSGAHWGNGAHWLTMVAVSVTEYKSRPRA